MYLSTRVAHIIACFMEAMLPDTPSVSFEDVRGRMQALGNDIFEPQRFDDPLLRLSVPAIFRIINWLPVICFWLIWRPVPLTWLPVAQRQKLFQRLEDSRIYGLRGLYATAKLFACMIFFHDESTWSYVGYDAGSSLPRVINPTPLDEIRS